MRCGSRLEQSSQPATQSPAAESSPDLPLDAFLDDLTVQGSDLATHRALLEETEVAEIGRPGVDENPNASGAALEDLELLPVSEKDSGEEESNPWRDELSARLEKLRERRDRARRNFDPSTSLELSFDHAAERVGSDRVGSDTRTAAFETARDVEHFHAEHSKNHRQQKPVEKGFAASERCEQEAVSEAKTGNEWLSGVASSRSSALDPVGMPLEFVASGGEIPTSTDEPMILRTAPLGRRFVAGVIDAIVLLVASGLFALIFRIVFQLSVGGEIVLTRGNLAIFGLIGIVALISYFASFAILTSSTPGMLWMGLEVQNMDGRPPTTGDSISRAFGYVVSLSALMLGFVWAAVDSEGLTWHDRMSGTLVTARDQD